MTDTEVESTLSGGENNVNDAKLYVLYYFVRNRLYISVIFSVFTRTSWAVISFNGEYLKMRLNDKTNPCR